jgi:hypothetical protein
LVSCLILCKSNSPIFGGGSTGFLQPSIEIRAIERKGTPRDTHKTQKNAMDIF